MLSRKYYEIIANVIKQTKRETNDSKTLKQLEWNMAIALKLDNERFNQDKFFEACELTKEDK